MDQDQFKKQNVKVIISEVFMVLAVIVTVIVLALLVSGYWLNSNFEIERNGMLQIYSKPTGASVEIDHITSSWLERTNSSKILASGPHSVTLTKDGYDSWTKDIVISEGLLYRLHYPRLFLNERYTEPFFDANKFTLASISSDHNAVLLINNTSEWTYLNLDSDSPSPRKIDVSKLFSSISLADNAEVGLYAGNIISLNWDHDASHVLIQSQNEATTEWVLLDVNNVSKSINLTREFGADFSYIEILDNNSNNLLAIQNHNLHKIDIPGRLISAILVNDIIDFDHLGNEIVYSAKSKTVESPESTTYYDVGYLKLGDSKATIVETTKNPVKVVIGKFYDSKYIAVLDNDTVSIHQKDTYQEDVSSFVLPFSPDTIKVGNNGEFLLLAKGSKLATLDLEANMIRQWEIEKEYGWLDNYMLYTVSGGDLIIYDFDGLNRRVIAHNVSSHFPSTITSDKWLYYFSDGNLVREWLVTR